VPFPDLHGARFLNLLVMELENFFYGALVGLEGIAIARDRSDQLLEESDGVLDVFVTMERDKSAGEKFADGLARGEARDEVAVAVLQHKDALQRGALRESEASLAVPRRAVHKNLPGIVAGTKFAGGTFTDNDAVVTEDVNFVQRSPEAGGGALPCSRVADEQVGRAVWAGDADTVELDSALLREAVHDQEFVERVG